MMMNRKKKLRIAQVSLLIFGSLVIFFTYHFNYNIKSEKIISSSTEEKLKKQISKDQNNEGDVFYNIEYSGLDLAGNRYKLISKEAFNNKEDQELVNMKFVEGIFYFKDGTILNIYSDKALYNNKTLDIIFDGDVKSYYAGSEMFAEKAEYSNSKNFLVVTGNVKVKDIRGTMFADKLFFDIKKKELNIASTKNRKVNTKINIK
tara:strand:- start:930 stop:1541 length:612 start_codon:yes stop_codon:yes gene_type:complete